MFALVLPVSMWHQFLMAKSMKKFLILCSSSQGLDFLKNSVDAALRDMV